MKKIITCECCGKAFSAKQDHGKWPRFCSRECFCKKAPKPINKICPACGNEFLAKRSGHDHSDGLTKHCSKTCAGKSRHIGEMMTCLQCGKEFYVTSKRTLKRGSGCCSVECNKKYYVGENAKTYKGGGYLLDETGERYVLRPGQEKAKSYIGEHRIIASKAIGRLLNRDEYVIRIIRDTTNNNPKNLFICKTIKDFCAMRDGKKPWPTKSNLDTYR